ncbi:hypothetical protein [Sediminicoccus sp. BL-A-41-H5]|uniref:hypothetical protein n=1 Tax=Sediminicoccus sp. BL-A-41-H5 TaxID=3421106 RepID=UPI003D66EF4C
MWDFSLPRALGLVALTWPFLMLRLLVFAGICAACVALSGLGAGIGWGIGTLFALELELTTFLGGAAGFGLTFLLLHARRPEMLFHVKAAHIAAMTALLDGQALPGGRAQIAHATALVQARFTSPALLLALDDLLRGALEAMRELLHGLSRRLIKTPVVQELLRILNFTLRRLSGWADEVILGHALSRTDINPWAATREGLLLHAQNTGALMRNTVLLMVPSFLLALALYVLMLFPAVPVARALPGGWGGGGLFFALVFAWAGKSVLIDPVSIACMLQAFRRRAEGQAPDPQWESHLAAASGPFRELTARA